MSFPGGSTAARTEGARALQRAGIIVDAVVIIGLLAFIAWSAQHRSDAGNPAAEQRIQQRLDKLRVQGGASFSDKTADQAEAAEPLAPLTQYAQSQRRVPGRAPAALASLPEGRQALEPLQGSMPVLDEGPAIAAQKRLRALPMIGGGNQEDRARASQQPQPMTSWSIQFSGENGSKLTEPASPASDSGKVKADLPQSLAQGTGTGQGTGGAQNTGGGQTASGGQNAGGGQAASSAGGGSSASSTGGSAASSGDGGQAASSSGGGQAADAGAAAADNSQQAGSGNQGLEIINIKARDMQYDPSHATLHAGDGEIFMYANSSLDAQVTLDSQAQGLSITARGDKAKGEWPTLTVSIDGTPIGEVVVNSNVPKKFYLPISVAPGQMDLQLTYTNDFYDPVAQKDRNVYVGRVKVVAQGAQGQ